MARRAAALLGLGLALAACARGVGEEETRLCRRALPALNPDGVELRVARETREGRSAVRIDYLVLSDGRSRRRWAICRFSEGPPNALAPDLVEIRTDAGPVSGAALYLMKRFWLSTEDAAAAEPRGR